MEKKTEYLLFVIASISILMGVYEVTRNEELSPFINGVLIGVSIIGLVLLERKKDNNSK